MTEPVNDPAAALASAVLDYRRQGDVGALLDQVRALAADVDPDELLAAARPYHELAEVVIPVYERVVSTRPNDAQAMVVLANVYWLTGRGSEVVGQLASRAIAADAANRGAWHLWALAEPDPRARTARWQRVVDTFPADQLARAALADNATSLAGAEHDPLALDLAVRTYESLWAEAARPEERRALEETISKLKGWTL
jgi:hypothetical protein